MFGPHVDRVHATEPGRPSITAHIRAARAAAADAGFRMRAAQIFAAGPRNMSMTLRPEEADELKAYVEETGMHVIAHGTYMDFPWNGKPYVFKFIRAELELCRRAGILGLVVHLGRPPLPDVVKHLPRLMTRNDGQPGAAAPAEPRIFLETPHVKPENSHYETPEKIANLLEEIRALDPDFARLGVCIDTAHLWSCGVDIRSYEDAEEWLRRLEPAVDKVPPGAVVMHLNDSFDKCGSGLDHHAPLLGGEIWNEYEERPRQSGLAAFVDYAVRHSTTVILERKPAEALLGDYAVLERLDEGVRFDAAPDGAAGAAAAAAGS